MKYVFAVGIILWQLCCARTVQAEVAFDWVNVLNAGNAADSQTGRGAVAYNYRIATTEVTNSQYTEFLNAVDPTGVNVRGLYNEVMDDNGGILNSGTVDGARYSITPGFENYPVNLVSWYDAARFVNWLHNGQGSGNTESGAYTILGGGATPTNAATIARNPGALFMLPNQDEWYKAAYHDPYAGIPGTYFDYPTGVNADTLPYSDNPNSLNTPDNTNVGNFFRNDDIANGYNGGYAVSGTTNPRQGGVSPYTNVGAYTLAASPYGTFDQGGNVEEWNETKNAGSGREIRGGSWLGEVNGLHVLGSGFFVGTAERPITGFRIASLEVPDPIDYILTVVYQTPEVTGPLVEGFDPLPPTITATVRLRDVIPGASLIGLGQVASFDLELPGENATADDLDSFQLALDSNGTPQSLFWDADDICTGDNLCGVDIANNNFTLDISGTDPATSQPFRYFYSESTNTFAPVPEPSGVTIVVVMAIAATMRRCRLFDRDNLRN
jgi:formylglycine-generating enzyme required for sulfatase activity